LDLLNGRHPLPLELNCEIFKCLPDPIQKKFIWAMGRGIYGIFRHKLLVKVNFQLLGIIKLSFLDQKTSKSSAKSLDPKEKDGKPLSRRFINQHVMGGGI
jgi:hypothetical protein